DQVAQDALELLAVERIVLGGSRAALAAAEGVEKIVLGIDEAEVDAVLLGRRGRRLLALVLGIEIDAELIALAFGEALADGFLDRAEGDGGGTVREPLHRLDAVLLEDPLHATDGIALAVEQATDALEQIDVIGAVVAAAAAPLHRLDLGEARLPE